MRVLFVVIALLAFSSLGTTAFAASRSYDADRGESFADPTFKELGELLFQMGTVNLEDNTVIDDYAKMYYCGLYREKYKEDFEWDKVRRQLVQRIKSKKDYYRTLYELDGTVDLDRYNFDAQDFPFSNDTAMQRVGSMILYDATLDPVQGRMFLCDDRKLRKGATHIIPQTYMIQFSQPLTFDRLKVSPEEAKGILDRMDAARNRERRLWVRFRMRVTGFDHLLPGQLRGAVLALRGEMVSIDVYYDKDMSKLLTTIFVPHL